MCPDSFFNAYMEAAIWSSADDDGEPMDRLGFSVSEETKAEMRADCDRFYSDNDHLIISDNCLTRFDCDEQAGHDFWLTRNGHGVGFWETNDWESEAGQALTDSSRGFGEYHLFVLDCEIVGENC